MSEKKNILGRFGKRFRRSRRHGCQHSCHQPKECMCPKCHLSIRSQNGIPCYQTICPNCGIPLARRFPQE